MERKTKNYTVHIHTYIHTDRQTDRQSEWWWWWLMFYGHFCAHGRLNGPSDLQKQWIEVIYQTTSDMHTPRFEHGWQWSVVQHATARARRREWVCQWMSEWIFKKKHRRISQPVSQTNSCFHNKPPPPSFSFAAFIFYNKPFTMGVIERHIQ